MAYRVAYSIIRHHEETEEVVQDAFMKAFKALNSFKGDAKFSTWLFRIIYYTSLNRLEKINSGKQYVDLDVLESHALHAVSNTGPDKLIGQERLKYLNLALTQLNAEDRMALTLYYLEEQSQKEISELTGWSLTSTKIRVHRSRAKFDQHLEQLLQTEKKSLL